MVEDHHACFKVRRDHYKDARRPFPYWKMQSATGPVDELSIFVLEATMGALFSTCWTMRKEGSVPNPPS